MYHNSIHHSLGRLTCRLVISAAVTLSMNSTTNVRTPVFSTLKHFRYRRLESLNTPDIGASIYQAVLKSASTLLAGILASSVAVCLPMQPPRFYVIFEDFDPTKWVDRFFLLQPTPFLLARCTIGHIYTFLRLREGVNALQGKGQQRFGACRDSREHLGTDSCMLKTGGNIEAVPLASPFVRYTSQRSKIYPLDARSKDKYVIEYLAGVVSTSVLWGNRHLGYTGNAGTSKTLLLPRCRCTLSNFAYLTDAERIHRPPFFTGYGISCYAALCNREDSSQSRATAVWLCRVCTLADSAGRVACNCPQKKSEYG
jgi:hypothetical protein